MIQPARSVPRGRLQRTAKVGGLLGGEVARAYAAKAGNLGRSPEDRREADGRRRLHAASHVVEVLGQMKGPAMKVGQMASVWDLWGLPPDEQKQLQAKLGELRDQAPQVAFKEMRKVIEQDLGDRIENVFAEFEPDAAAAASIGQVYRARLHDGREVAVKAQYPHVAGAVHADLQNLGLVLRAAKRFAPGLDPASVARELRERISEELDYEHEAQAQRAFARQWRGHPFIVIPNVITSLCRARVLVAEWVDGLGFEQIKQTPQVTRDRVGEIVIRFFFGSLYRFGQFSGDPQPGNFLLRPDGRVAFIDFGMTKRVPRSRVTAELAVLRAGLERDPQGVHAGLAALGFFGPDDPRFGYGIGGGSILAPILIALGYSVYEVAPATLAATFLTSIAGIATYQVLQTVRGGTLAPAWILGAFLGAGGFAGSHCGARLQSRLPERNLRRLLGLIACLVAARYIQTAASGASSRPLPARRAHPA